ncbi:MAG: hypothetical protein LRZ97_01215 [Candidatus Pacebacteria bacterium]|nr:hypothetical protein [Candidatus Paceibacterota bacterium]
MTGSIKEIIQKIKHFYTFVPLEFLFAVIIILVGLSSFGLGRLSVLEETREHIQLTYNTELSTKSKYNNSGAVVVSVKGSKYHYPWCSGALRMNEKNKRWYDSVELAEAAGYEPAGNCKGL